MMMDIRFRYKVALSCIVIMMVFVTLSGFSYAYFVAEVTGEGKPFTVTTEGVKLTLTEDTDNNISLVNTMPILDAEGLKGTPHTFTLANGNTYPVIAKIYLSVDKTSELKAESIKYAYVDNNGNFGTQGALLSSLSPEEIESGSTSYLLGTASLTASGTEGATMSGFKLLLWIDSSVGDIQSCDITGDAENCETPLDATMNKTFKAYITIKTEPNKDGSALPSDIPNQGVNEGPQIFDDPSEITGTESEVVTPEVTEPENTNPGESEIPNNDVPVVEEPGTEEVPENGEGMEEPSIG